MTLLADSAVAAEFPLLRETGLAYLDSAATAQKPRAVIETVEDFTARHNASVHRGVYPLAAEASARYEAARCLSCGNCFECDNCYGVCPDNAVIKLGPGKRFEFNYDYCKGCGMCVAECPFGAIKMEAEEI